MSIEQHLARIATALEAIAQAVNPGVGVLVDEVESIAVPTITNPPLRWFATHGGAAVAVEDSIDDDKVVPDGKQTTWDWLGITPPASRTRKKMPESGRDLAGKQQGPGRKIPGKRQGGSGREPGTVSRCGRCRRDHRRRMNHSNRCIDCQHEEWWDE